MKCVVCSKQADYIIDGYSLCKEHFNLNGYIDAGLIVEGWLDSAFNESEDFEDFEEEYDGNKS